MQCGSTVKCLWFVLDTGSIEGIRNQAFAVDRDPDKVKPQVCRKRQKTGIGQRLDADGFAWSRKGGGDCKQRALRARADQNMVGVNRFKPGRQPLSAGRAIAARSSCCLIPQQEVETSLGLQAAYSIPHARNDTRVVETRRKVHAHINQAAGGRPNRYWPLESHIRALPDLAFDQSPFARFSVCTTHSREVDPQQLRKGPLRRQTGATSESA